MESDIEPSTTQLVPSHDPATGVRTWTYVTPDGNAGNVTVDLVVTPAAEESGPAVVGVVARGSSTTLADGASDFYAAWLHVATGRVGITLRTGRKSKALASLTPAGTPPPGQKKLSFVLSGETLSLTVQDPASLHWLQPDGTYKPVPAAAVVATDSTLSGSGHAGYYAVQPAR